MPPGLLTDDELDAALLELDGWEVVDGKLHRQVELTDFSEAFGFMARVALAAEKLDHHPDWSNSWNTVVIDISNHAAGGLTKVCVELASSIDRAIPGGD